MRKKLLAIFTSVLLLCTMIPLGAVSVGAASSMNTSYRNAKGYEFAIFPLGPNFHISQKWYGSYSHGNQIAVDCVPLTSSGGANYSAQIYAPFTGQIVASYSSWGCVVFQSNEPVQYADGTVDIMTVVFGHDNNSETYAKHITVQQGAPLCAPGTAGGYAYHTHIFVVRGTWQDWCNGGYREAGQTYVNSGGGNVVPTDAFFFDGEWTRDWTHTPGTSYYPDNMVDWLSLYSDEAQMYANNLITNFYNSHCDVRVTSKTTYIKSLPCSEDSDPNSANVEIAQKGDVYEAIKLCKNKWGKLWYQVKAKNGKIGYMYAGDTTFVAQRLDDVWVENLNAPDSLEEGESFSIRGTISTAYQTISRVQAWVSGYNNDVDYLYGHEWVDVTTYNLSGSAVDSMLAFHVLDAGDYRFMIRVAVSTYYAVDGETVNSIIKEGISLHGSVFTVGNSSCNHSYGVTTVSPSCTEGGYSIYTCTYCGYEYTDHFTEPMGHKYKAYTYAPSCVTEGYTEYWCQRCGYSYTTDYTDSLWHDYVVNIVNPTCTQQGYTEYWCQRCGDFYIDDYVPSGHVYDNDYDGTCNVCGAVRETPLLPPAVSQINGVSEIIVMFMVPEWGVGIEIDSYTGFFVNDRTVVTAADLISDDKLVEWAQRFNLEYGMNYTALQLKKNLSLYAKSGGEFYLATIAEERNGIAALTLSESVDHCTPLTLRDSTELFWGDAVYALGTHGSVEGGTAKGASYMTLQMNDGTTWNEVQCIENTALLTAENVGGPLVDADGYVVGMNFAASSYGSIAVGSREIMNLLDDLGISYATSLILGDANGDGAVNARDAAVLQQFVAAWDVTLKVLSADANGDGFVNARDVALLQQYVAGWDVTLG